MKRLLVAVILAILAYSAWWFYAAHDLRSSVADWFAGQRAAGLQADYADLTVLGFPNRTDLTITEPALAAADSGFGWQAPFLQILGLSYKQGHVIVAWPDAQTLTTPEGDIDITSDGLRASVVHEDGMLIRTNLEATVLNLTGQDQALAMADVNGALQRIETTPSSYRIALSIGSMAATSPQAVPQIGPDSLASLRAELDLGLDQPLSFDALTGAPAQITNVTLHRSEITYGSVTFKVTGEATLDNEGRASGEITLSAENWREAIAAARDSGALPPALSDGLIDLLSMLSTFNGARDELDVTLGLNRGTVLLGPIPIGTLPPIQWR
ncbi:MAG: DUF2125 domain-containing protein [Pelagibaca sp.]